MRLDVLLEWIERAILSECLKSQRGPVPKNTASSGSNGKNQYSAKIMQDKLCFFLLKRIK